MTRKTILSLNDGDSVEEVYLAQEKQLRANRNGNNYLQVELRDKSGVITARQWNAGEPQYKSFENGDFLHVRGKVQLFQGTLQMILNGFDKVPIAQVDLGEFLPRTQQDIVKLLEKVRGYLRQMANPHLRALAEAFFMDESLMAAYCQAPAGIRHHHAYLGGLVEHVANLLDAWDRLAPLYPFVDRDLLFMGLFLHDIGKVREMVCDKALSYSDEGQLIGHIVQGVEILNEKIPVATQLAGEPLNPELLMRLRHMILSHHGTYEFGSPRVPMTLEAVALHHLDNLDAKINAYYKELEEAGKDAVWTPYNNLLGRKLYKGGKSPVEGSDGEV
ncbi:MAG: HD domain-containing protein [Gemmataceae bacterium]|nr:HD domain-containing protein [Gemmataceae bacterium]